MYNSNYSHAINSDFRNPIAYANGVFIFRAKKFFLITNNTPTKIYVCFTGKPQPELIAAHSKKE